MTLPLNRQTAVITGAGSAEGIGFAIARRLYAAGARIVITSTTDRIHTRARELDAEIAHGLRIAVGEDELAAVKAVPRRTGSGLFRLLRDRVVLDLLVYTAGRASAIGRLLVGDLRFDHVGPQPDLRTWPTLLLPRFAFSWPSPSRASTGMPTTSAAP